MWACFVGESFTLRIKLSALVIWLCFFTFDHRLYTFLLFLAMLCHEGGHLLCLYACGKRRVRMTLSAFGAEIYYAPALLSLKQELLVALGGVGINLVSAVMLLLFGVGQSCLYFAVASLTLATLNLLPIKGLDGGRALDAVLLRFFVPERAYRLQKCISFSFIFPLFVLSVCVLVQSGFNFSLLLFTLYLTLTLLGK